MPTKNAASNITAPTQFLEVGEEKYAFRRFGAGRGLPLLCLQHFTGTMDNWDPAVTDRLADGREVILFENAGVGRSGGTVPTTMAGMAAHAFAFLDGLGIKTCDVLGFSLGGMVAQQMAVERPSVFRRMLLAEDHLPIRAIHRSPRPDPPLQRPPRPGAQFRMPTA